MRFPQCGTCVWGYNDDPDPPVIEDDFEDGVINSNLWSVGGERWDNQTQPPGVGNWVVFHDEVTDPSDPDGYLEAGVSGPTSGNSFGADAWVRSIYNFNDGQSYLINFTWEPKFLDGHYNGYYVQITDGDIPSTATLHWPREGNYAGTKNFL